MKGAPGLIGALRTHLARHSVSVGDCERRRMISNSSKVWCRYVRGVNRWSRLEDGLCGRVVVRFLTANYGSRAISDDDANQPYIFLGPNKHWARCGVAR